VDHLPLNVTHLTFGARFNQSVNHLPLNVTHLVFGKCFDQFVNHLPPNMMEVRFHMYYKRSIIQHYNFKIYHGNELMCKLSVEPQWKKLKI